MQTQNYIKIPMIYNFNGKIYTHLYIETYNNKTYILTDDEEVIDRCYTGHDMWMTLKSLDDNLYM